MHIEELTEQLERAANLADSNGPTQPADSSDATKPPLPPALALNKRMTPEEILADLNKSPLFMTDLEENDDIAALQALDYEGTPLENAVDFKERGNESFKLKGFVDAREFYNKGILMLAPEERKRAKGGVTKNPDGVVDSEEVIEQQRATLVAMYVNRAACHLELKNYRSCWTDCASALRINPRNVKAYYRSAKALLAVDRIEEADDVCARGLALDEGNKPLHAVAADIVKRAEVVFALRKKDAERDARNRRREYLLKAALTARGIPMRNSAKPPDMEDAKIELVPDQDDPRSTLSFPTLLLYPEDFESDFIRAFNETQTLEDHLWYVFPLPWDSKGAYSLAGVTCYVETREGGVLKMGKRVSLLKVLSTGKVEIVDQLVKIYVLPTDKADEWVKKFKAQKGLEKGRRG